MMIMMRILLLLLLILLLGMDDNVPIGIDNGSNSDAGMFAYVEMVVFFCVNIDIISIIMRMVMVAVFVMQRFSAKF